MKRDSILRQALVERKPDDHKGRFGHVLIVAGSRGMSGAAALATRAALRSGAGLVTAAVPAGVQSLVAAAAPEALTLGLPDSAAGSLSVQAAAAIIRSHEERGYTALAVGPGLTHRDETAAFLLELLGALQLPAVVDADALNILAAADPSRARQLLRARPRIFTPHPGELARCLRVRTADAQADREGSAKKLALEWGGVVVLKGHRTIVCDAERVEVNVTGGPGLAKGGTGDVLTGLVAGLWAQRMAAGADAAESAFGAAALGVFLHGSAGDAAERAKTSWAMTAQDVIDQLPQAFLAVSGRHGR